MIVIGTPTGQIGRQVLSNVLRDGRGEPVRVIAREPARLSPQARERAEIVQGSLTDIDVLLRALAGADSMFWLLPPDPLAVSFEAHLADFAQPLRAALDRQGVSRLVYVSGLGEARAGGSSGTAPLSLDDLIGSTGVSSRVLPCPAFMDNLIQQLEPIRTRGMFCYPVSGDRRLPVCATRDIAAVAARQLLDHSWSGQGRIPVLGPEDLSYNDMARIMSEVLQRPVRYQQVPGEAFTTMLIRQGMTAASARWLAGRLARVDQGLYNAEPRTPQSTTPTSFRQWCQAVLRPAVLG